MRTKDSDALNNLYKHIESLHLLGSWELDLVTYKALWSEQTYINYGYEPYSIEPSLEFFFSRLVPDDEMTAVVRSYLFDLEFSRDQSEAMAVRYGWGLQADYIRTLEQDCCELRQLTAEQVQQVARDLFCRQGAKLVVVGPWTDGDRQQVEQLLHDSNLLQGAS